MPTSSYHLILGANLGDRLAQIELARKLISTEIGKIAKESSYYETQPWGVTDQPWFINQVIMVKTTLRPLPLLDKLKTIEKQVGRQASEKWNARHIDIDILLHGDEVFTSDILDIPHPLMAKRNFVLVPLMEIAGEVINPATGKTIEEMYFESKDQGEVYIFSADDSQHTV